MYRLEDGRAIDLGRQLGNPGGEGTIFEVTQDRDLVAKVFHPLPTTGSPADIRRKAEEREAKRRKVVAMAAAKPTESEQNNGKHVVMAWPEHVLLKQNGSFAGYLMPKLGVAACVQLGRIENASARRDPRLKPTWPTGVQPRHLWHIAINLCRIVELTHSLHAVIGDFNEANVLVSREAIVTLVDCDSMQITDSAGHNHLCVVGIAKYLAPELIGKDFTKVVRKPSSDLFGLAVHVHMLLAEGVAPFSGKWTGRGERPGSATLAMKGIWIGQERRSLEPAENQADPRDFFPEPIMKLFRRAFEAGATNPAARPSAREWRLALSAEVV